jgi:hypothetical protein
MDGERMNAALELVRQRRVDHAMAFEPALPLERTRHNIKTEMAFAARPVSGVALVQMGFILDMHAFRRESRHQSGSDDILHSHFAALSHDLSHDRKHHSANMIRESGIRIFGKDHDSKQDLNGVALSSTVAPR